MRFGKTQCTTCWAWSKSRTYVLANTVLDETYGTGVTVSDRYCPKCGDTVRFPPSDLDEEERSVTPRVAASMKGLVGFRCPGCGRLDWRWSYKANVVASAKLGGFGSNLYRQTIERRHPACGYTWKANRTYRKSAGSWS